MQLQEESGIPLETAEGRRFRQAILTGCWNEALSVLDGWEDNSNSNTDGRIDTDALAQLRFTINRERFLELVHSGRARDALVVLRDCITPMFVQDVAQVKDLAK